MLWSEKILDTISIFLNLLRLDLWPKMWSILGNVPCALEKKVYSSAFGWKVLKISIRSIWSNVPFKDCVSLLILSFDVCPLMTVGSLRPLLLLCCCWFLLLCLFSSVQLLSRVRLFVNTGIKWNIRPNGPNWYLQDFPCKCRRIHFLLKCTWNIPQDIEYSPFKPQ